MEKLIEASGSLGFKKIRLVSAQTWLPLQVWEEEGGRLLPPSMSADIPTAYGGIGSGFVLNRSKSLQEELKKSGYSLEEKYFYLANKPSK